MSDVEIIRARLIAEGDELADYADRLIALSAPSFRLEPVHSHSKVAIATDDAGFALPALVPGLDAGVVAVAGRYHHMALMEDGTIRVWGENRTGKIGDGTRADRRRPVAVPACIGVVAIAAGAEHSAALTADGTVLVWGGNSQGQMGDGTYEDQLRPRQLDLPSTAVSKVACGERTTVVVFGDGSVIGCGLWSQESSIADMRRPVPLDVAGLDRPVRDIAPGSAVRFAICDDGSLVGWSAQEGVARAVPCGRVAAVDVGHGTGVAASAEGLLFHWEVRLEVLPDEQLLVVPGVTGAVGVAAGSWNAFCVLSDGSVLSWGLNFLGCLGDGTSTARALPAPIAGVERAVAVAPGLALTDTGGLLQWGGLKLDRGGPQGTAITPGSSRLGGRPDLAKGKRWPTSSDDRPLAFVAQLDLAALFSKNDAPAVLPDSGLLSFFLDDCSGEAAVLHTPAGTPLSPRTPPADLAEGSRFRPIAVRAVGEPTLPPAWSSFTEEVALDEDASVAYQQLCDDVRSPAHRMLGHPDAVQSDPRSSSDEVLLLQVDSDPELGTMWGDAGRVYFLIASADLASGRFDRARAELGGH